jgi:hypothetical protein
MPRAGEMRFSGELDWIYTRVLEKAKANLFFKKKAFQKVSSLLSTLV